MQRIQMPQVISDVKYKISVIEARIASIEEGIELYTEAAKEEEDPLKAYNYREQVLKRKEELVLYTEQLKSQKVYLTEFENDLRKQQEMRKQQLNQVKKNVKPMVDLAKKHVKSNKLLTDQDRMQLKSLRESFVKDDFKSDDEKINRFRQMSRMLQQYSKIEQQE